MMRNEQLSEKSVVSVTVPEESRISSFYAKTDLADAYAIRLPANSIKDPELLARHVLAGQADWMRALMRLRDILVAAFGIKTSGQLQGVDSSSRSKHIYIFRIYESSANEIVLGEDDKHLDFRLSLLLQTRDTSSGDLNHLTLSTVVHCHNLLGRVYLFIISPFHRLIVKSMLRRAATAGWPTSP